MTIFPYNIPRSFFGFDLIIATDRREIIEGVVHKLRLQDEVGRWSKNVHFLSTFIPQKMSTEGGRWSKKGKILST